MNIDVDSNHWKISRLEHPILQCVNWHLENLSSTLESYKNDVPTYLIVYYVECGIIKYKFSYKEAVRLLKISLI